MKNKWLVRGDIDGFFGLFIDNLVQLIVIAELCSFFLKFPDELVYGRILPGAALSVLLGNLFYGFQARQLMKKTGRDDVTALPYGINTPSIFAFIFFIMLPVYLSQAETDQEKAIDLAWQTGLLACLFSGLMEAGGAFMAKTIRRITPRAALLAPLAGIAITFISMDFVFEIFQSPVIALLPMFLIIFAYAAKQKLPFGIPAGLLAIIVAFVIALGSKAMGFNFYQVKELTFFSIE